VAAQLTTRTSELEDSRVRVEVEVAADDVEREIQRAAKALGNDLKIPGFRKGKVPPQVVLQRVGRDAVLDEAVRHALPEWYERAVLDAGVATVGDPSVDLEGGMPDKGEPLTFSIEVGVRPKAQLGEYKGLEVGRRDAEVSDEQLEQELEQIRESGASLETVERAAQSGDFVVVDFVGSVDGEPFEGGEARGYPLELGSGRLVEGFEEQLVGASAGDERSVEVTFPDDYRAEELAGKDAVFAVTVKEVKEKRLPELDDDMAIEAGFDTLDELRGEVSGRIREAQEREIEGEYREAAVDAAADTATIDLPHSLIHAKAHEMWASTVRRLQQQGLDPSQYLQLTGKSEHDLINESEPDAERALRREAVLAAIVEAEGIEVTDDELLDSLRQVVAAGGREPDEETVTKTLERIKEEGRDGALREDVAMRKAVDALVEHAKPIPAEQAEARDKLWTPEKEQQEKPAQIWTPGS
jgi:trigger factor